MTAERYIKAIIYVTVLVWTVVLYANHEAIKSVWLQPLSTVITIMLYAVMAFDLWLWKILFLHGWFVKRPVIDGTWKVEIRSNWKNPATGVAVEPVEGYMVIRQTFSTLSLRLLTEESSSELVGTEIVCSADGLYCVSGVYRNEPRFQVRESSAIHYGAVWLRIIPGAPVLNKSQRDIQVPLALSDRRACSASQSAAALRLGNATMAYAARGAATAGSSPRCFAPSMAHRDEPLKKVIGHYWTDRETAGENGIE